MVVNMCLRYFAIGLCGKTSSNVPCSKQELEKEHPVLKLDFIPSLELVGKSGTGMQVAWLGHASVRVEMGEIVILTDPFFRQWASPEQFMGPEHFQGPLCTLVP